MLAYVLLGNHYHALVRIPDRCLERALQTAFANAPNWRHRYAQFVQLPDERNERDAA